jgi:hypothetical protein
MMNIGGPKKPLLDGMHPEVERSAQMTRQKIVEWLSHFDLPVPQLGNFVEGSDARLYTRGDLLALDMVRNGTDMPEGEARTLKLQEYVSRMAKNDTWGSTPEYTAAACMLRKTVRVWQRIDGKLINVSSVFGSPACEDAEKDDEIHLLYGGHHYQPLITREDYKDLVDAYGEDTCANFVAL